MEVINLILFILFTISVFGTIDEMEEKEKWLINLEKRVKELEDKENNRWPS